MSFLGGLGAQTVRNLTLEPWHANTRAEGGTTRAGELVADAGFIVHGGGAAAAGVLVTRSATGLLGRAAGVALAGVGALAAATGVKNLLAQHPASPPKPTDPPTGPTDPVDPPTPTDPADPTDPPAPTDPQEPSRPQPNEPTRPAGPVRVQHHVVCPGETLAFIADCFEVDWRALYTFNREVIGSNPDQIFSGMSLAIPPRGYAGEQFHYHPTAPAGQLPPGLDCDPASPSAQRSTCTY